MNVLIIPEDPRKDKYVLKPLFQALFRSIKKPHIRVLICEDQELRGVEQALKSENIQNIIQQYQGKVKIFILCVDRDAEEGRLTRLQQIEREFNDDSRSFLAVNAWEEIETWILATFDVQSLRNKLNLSPIAKYSWKYIRAERDPKETYFEPLAAICGVADAPDGGRKKLGKKAASRIKQIRQKCPEDFGDLANRLENIIKDQP